MRLKGMNGLARMSSIPCIIRVLCDERSASGIFNPGHVFSVTSRLFRASNSVSFGNLARSPLSLASVFDLCQWMVGAPACHRRFLRDFIMPKPGDRVVDLGCGTGGTFRYFPDGISYVGLDINPHYIRAAQERYPGRGTFVCCDAVTADLSQ